MIAFPKVGIKSKFTNEKLIYPSTPKMEVKGISKKTGDYYEKVFRTT
jgi:hypothetical protein